jgi:hypothetical protein
MLRRFVRLFCMTVLALFLATGVVAQFWTFYLWTPLTDVYMASSGVRFDYPGIFMGWDADCHRAPRWSVKHLLYLPESGVMNGIQYSIDLPWWFVLASWGLLTVAVWRWTRRRYAGGSAFPVEPTKKAEG